jgi:hypothetical protein
MTPQGMLDPELLIGPARTIALEVARSNNIFLSPNALGAVDLLVEERLPTISRRFQDGSLDFTSWLRTVRLVAERVAATYQARNIARVNDPQDVVQRVHSALKVYPFDC